MDERAHDRRSGGGAFFAAWARLLLRRRAAAAIILLGSTAALVAAIVERLEVDNSLEAFVASRSESYEVLQRYRESFGREEFFLLLVEGDVFSRPYLERLERLHDEAATLDLALTKPPPEPPATEPVPGEPSVEAPVDDAFGGFVDAGGDDAFGDFDDADAGGDDGWGDVAGGTIIDEATSLINVRRTRGRAGTISVGPLLDPLPPASALPAIRDEVLADPLLVGQVVDRTGRFSVIALRTQLLHSEDSDLVHDALTAIAAQHTAPGFGVRVLGMPALTAEINRIMLSDMHRLIVVAAFTMLFILLLLYRHPIGVIGPWVVVILAVVWTLGLMAVTGMPMTMLTNILPAFISCVGIGDSVHVQSVYRTQRQRGRSNHDAIVEAVASTGVPVVFTTLTTVIGLLSFRLASVDAIQEMGTAGAFGVVAAMVHTFVLIPIFLSWNKTSLLGLRPRAGRDRIDAFLEACRDLSGRSKPAFADDPRRRRRLLWGLAAFGALAAVGAGQLRVWHNPLSWIPEDAGILVGYDLMDEHLGGTSTVNLLVEAKGSRGVKDLELLRGLEALVDHVRAYRAPAPEGGPPEALVGNASSLLDVVKETRRALHGGDPAAWRLPDSQRELDDLLFLFENAGPDHLRRLTTADFSRTQLSFRIRWQEATSYAPLTHHIAAGVAEHVGDKAVVRATGSVYLLFTIVSALIWDLLKSFGTALVVITLLMVVMLRGVKLGLIAMVPNLLPIVGILGFMGAVGIPIDMNNLMIASIAIGIAVDDTIHFLHQFRVRYAEDGDTEAGLSHAFDHAGRALISTSAILCAGFCVYTTASMANIQRFGLLVGMTVILALLIDLIGSPALLRTFFPTSHAAPVDPSRSDP